MTKEVITTKQRKTAKLFKEMLEGKETKEGKELLDKGGYSESMQENPKKVFESVGFKLALKELGFSIEAADLAITKILRVGKEENRIKSAQEIYKRLGAYKQPSQGNQTNILILPTQIINKYDREPNTSTGQDS